MTSSGGWSQALVEYATDPHPENLDPNGTRLLFTSKTITVWDAFPKSTHHFLLLPRPHGKWTKSKLRTLGSMLKNSSREDALELLETMREDSKAVVKLIEEVMRRDHGCTWGINIGFHAVQSMDHVHLHIISNDLISKKITKKEHYNSFHPTAGFFLHLDEVIGWCKDQKLFDQMKYVREGEYKAIKTRRLVSWRTNEEFKTLPPLKEHLERTWKAETREARMAHERRRKEAIARWEAEQNRQR